MLNSCYIGRCIYPQQLEKIQNDGQVEKPFEHKLIRFRFPEMERSGLIVAEIKKLYMEYNGMVSSCKLTSLASFCVCSCCHIFIMVSKSGTV
jgi:hypothetical protein